MDETLFVINISVDNHGCLIRPNPLPGQ